MRRSLGCLAALIGTLVGPGALAAADDVAGRDRYDLVFLGAQRPVFLRIELSVDGDTVASVRRTFADRMFATLDRDKSGSLEDEELGQIPNLSPGAGGTTTDGTALDTDPPDGLVSPDELAQEFDRQMGPTLVVELKAGPLSQTLNLFSRLDTAGDGYLTPEDVTSGVARMQRFDLDDDESFSLVELQPFQATSDARDTNELPFLLLQTQQGRARDELLRRYGLPAGEGLPRGVPLALALPLPQTARFDVNGDQRLDDWELRQLLADPPIEIPLEVRLYQRTRGRPSVTMAEGSDAAADVAQELENRLALPLEGATVEVQARSSAAAYEDNRRFYQLQFRIADRDRNKYLDENEFAMLNLPAAGFQRVDRDGDGMLMQDEVLTYVDQQALVELGRIVLTVSRESESLFELLDADVDLRVSPRELLDAGTRLLSLDRDGDGRLHASEFVGRFQLHLELGKPVLFQPAMMRPPMANAGVPRMSGASAGPEWFRRMDRNRDGDVSAREFLGTSAQFERLDVDGDGLVAPSEAENLVP